MCFQKGKINTLPNWTLETGLLPSLVQGKNVIYQEANNCRNKLPEKTFPKNEKKHMQIDMAILAQHSTSVQTSDSKQKFHP